MPLVQGSSREAISENIVTERRAGKPADQAAAIAYSTARKNNKKGVRLTSKAAGLLRNRPSLFTKEFREYLQTKNVTDSSGHEHAEDSGQFTGSGGGGKKPAGEGKKPAGSGHATSGSGSIRGKVDAAVAAMRKIEEENPKASATKLRSLVVSEASKQAAEVKKHLDEVFAGVKTKEDAAKVAGEYGLRDTSGSKDDILKRVEQAAMGRIHSFARAHA